MMRWIVGSSLQFRFLVVGVAAAMMVFGVIRLRDMPVDVFPEFSPPSAEIQTEAIGLSASEVESLVTLNTEELLAGRAVAEGDALAIGHRHVVRAAPLRARHQLDARAAAGPGTSDPVYLLPNVSQRR